MSKFVEFTWQGSLVIQYIAEVSNRCLWNALVKNPTGPPYNLLPPTRTAAENSKLVRDAMMSLCSMLGQSMHVKLLFANRCLFNLM